MSFCAILSQYIVQLSCPGVQLTGRNGNRRSKIQSLLFPQNLPSLNSLSTEPALHRWMRKHVPDFGAPSLQ